MRKLTTRAARHPEFSAQIPQPKTEKNHVSANPELLGKPQPVLDKFGVDLDAKVKVGTSDLHTKAAKQFDPSDPTSPMAKHTAELDAQQKRLATQIADNHKDLAKKVDELTTAVKVQEARANLAKVTPIKGDRFENQLNAVF